MSHNLMAGVERLLIYSHQSTYRVEGSIGHSMLSLMAVKLLVIPNSVKTTFHFPT